MESKIKQDVAERCAICGWPLVESANKGCMRGNCSMRPFPRTFFDYDRACREYNHKFEFFYRVNKDVMPIEETANPATTTTIAVSGGSRSGERDCDSPVVATPPASQQEAPDWDYWASMFHYVCEDVAPFYGYETRPETRRKEWDQVPENNRKLMRHVVSGILTAYAAASAPSAPPIVKCEYCETGNHPAYGKVFPARFIGIRGVYAWRHEHERDRMFTSPCYVPPDAAPSALLTRMPEIANYLRAEAERKSKEAIGRLESGKDKEITVEELKAVKVLAEKMSGRELPMASIDLQRHHEYCDMQVRIGHKLESEAKQLFEWAELLSEAEKMEVKP